ncbi:MAG: RdgB/HAM1 family non-canonical purine NTP pyrophosphatase [Chloroflexi bacterium]|nr:RdgB/HAM1 family non-canonical purine NTP pyrophosphatase [Chloroflexota bacterium]
MARQLLVATKNQGKLKEYQEILDGLGDIEWLSLWDVGLGHMEVEETGATFEENAGLKAEAYANAAGMLTLADDSGLVVDALNGAPGVYSARYGAPEAATDIQRYQLLLKNLASVEMPQRTARFACVVGIGLPEQAPEFAVGYVEGHVGFEPRGSNGFGYDPVFLLPDGRTMAELPSDEKHRISHRGRALQAALPILQKYFAR